MKLFFLNIAKKLSSLFDTSNVLEDLQNTNASEKCFKNKFNGLHFSKTAGPEKASLLKNGFELFFS